MLDGEIAVNGITLGLSPYILTAAPTGLFDVAAIRSVDESRPNRHGVIAGPDYLGPRLLAFEVAVIGATPEDSEDAALDLSEAFAPNQSDVVLTARATGTPSEYAFFGRPRGVDFVLDSMRPISTTASLIRARCSFLATDPIRYGPSTSQAISIAAHTIPATLPFTLGLYGNQTISVSGTADLDRWTVTFAAPAGGSLIYPRILHVGQNQLVQVDRTVPASNQLVLDGYSGTATLGVVDTTIVPTSVSQWFSLTPGSNTLRFSAADGSHTSSTATIAWRPGWL